MKIGLLDIDSHNFPNLALMKISSYHKSLGDDVEWVNFFNHYDIVYQSKIFTFSPDNYHHIDSDRVIKGGTGYDYSVQLPPDIEKTKPDYSLYPQFENAYGFLTRGCPNNCSWCIVPKKEGVIKPYSDIEDILQGRKSAILMDNNVLASEWGISQIEKIIRLGVKIDFNQGLDARLIANDESIAELLSKVKWIRFIRTACDTKSQVPFIERALHNLNKYGVKNYRVFSYLLVRDINDAHIRARYLRRKGVDVFAQPYRDFVNNELPTKEQRRFARWVNHKAIFKTVTFENYK